jgi:hypothetical protein
MKGGEEKRKEKREEMSINLLQHQISEKTEVVCTELQKMDHASKYLCCFMKH